MNKLNSEVVLLDNENQTLSFFNPSANKVEHIDSSLFLYFFSQGLGTFFSNK